MTKPHSYLTDKTDIEAWLKKMQISSYTLVPDEDYGFVVDVVGDVNLKHNNLNYIPVKFNSVEGNFDCSYNKLKSLLGSPKTITKSFDCSLNSLKSLVGAPQAVPRIFNCHKNKLTSLVGGPVDVGGAYLCSSNLLTNLVGAPKQIYGNFEVNYNRLTSLRGSPVDVLGGFDAGYNRLTNLIGAPKFVRTLFNVSSNKINSLEGIEETAIGETFMFQGNRVENLQFFPQKVGVTIMWHYNSKLNYLGEARTYKELYPYHVEDAIKGEKRKLDKTITIDEKKSRTAQEAIAFKI